MLLAIDVIINYYFYTHQFLVYVSCNDLTSNAVYSVWDYKLHFYYIALKDFKKRQFKKVEDKRKFRSLLYIVPFGQFFYFQKIKKY